MPDRKLVPVFFIALIGLGGCAAMAPVPGGVNEEGSVERQMDYQSQMTRNPISCLLIKMIDSVASNDMNGFRETYRWAGFEAGDDFLKFRSMMLTSTMPFTMRLDPPLFEITGRGEADLARMKSEMACPRPDSPNPDGFVVREVRGITFESLDFKCQVELFHGADNYTISRVVWVRSR